MTVPATAEILLLQQYFHLQRKLLESKDPSTLEIIYHLLSSLAVYISGKEVLDKLPKLHMAKSTATDVRVEVMKKEIFVLNYSLADLIRQWMEQKRIMYMQGA